MEFNYSKVNGTHPSINYEVLIDSIQKKLSKTVKRADLILLNEFPVAVSSKSDIDLILFLNIPKWANSYYRTEYQGTRINIHNQIVTITVIDDFIEDDLTSISNEELIYRFDDLASVASKVKWGLVNYLSDKCEMKKRDVTVHSVVWVKNPTMEKVLPKVVVSSELTYDLIEASLVSDKYYNRSAYSKWLKDYGDFDLYLEWRIPPGADSGIYLRGTPQVQIWDPWDPRTKEEGTLPPTSEAWVSAYNNGRNLGSGGLWNNRRWRNSPLTRADNPPGEWNQFLIRMVGDKVTIWLNDKLIVDRVELENYWDKTGKNPLPRADQIELQHHGSALYFRNLFIRELPY